MPRLVMSRQQFALNVFAETTRLMAFIFSIEYCLVNLYHVCSVGDPRVKDGPAAGVLVSKSNYA